MQLERNHQPLRRTLEHLKRPGVALAVNTKRSLAGPDRHLAIIALAGEQADQQILGVGAPRRRICRLLGARVDYAEDENDGDNKKIFSFEYFHVVANWR